MSHDRLYTDPRFAAFYDRANGWGEDYGFCLDFVRGASSVLDLGCGTGWFLSELPDGMDGVGVDPAGAMLMQARTRPGGDRHKWIEADARRIDLGRTFHRVVMTGHAFQVFLTDADRLAVLKTIARHLDPDRGKFIFDTRNPAAREWETWTPDQWRKTLDDPELGQVTTWTDARFDAHSDTVTYLTYYRIDKTGETLKTHARIGFVARDDLKRLLEEAGLRAEIWYGTWTGKRFKDGDPELIPTGRLARQ